MISIEHQWVFWLKMMEFDRKRRTQQAVRAYSSFFSAQSIIFSINLIRGLFPCFQAHIWGTFLTDIQHVFCLFVRREFDHAMVRLI